MDNLNVDDLIESTLRATDGGSPGDTFKAYGIPFEAAHDWASTNALRIYTEIAEVIDLEGEGAEFLVSSLITAALIGLATGIQFERDQTSER